MLSCIDKFYFTNNKIISEYCRKSTMDSIKKKVDYYNLERNKPKFTNPLYKNSYEDDDIPKFNLFGFLAFLSISTLGIFLYKRIE